MPQLWGISRNPFAAAQCLQRWAAGQVHALWKDEMETSLQTAAASAIPAPRLGATNRGLDAFFHPRAIVVVGATEAPNSVGRTLLTNLTTGAFRGNVYPVNRKHSTILDRKAYPSVRELPEHVDLAVIVTPARTVPGIIAECREAGVKGAVVISAGFSEIGPAGARSEQRDPRAKRAQAGIRIIGPNCLGVMSPRHRPERHLRRQRRRAPATSASSARAARSAPPFSTGASARRSASAPSSPSAPCSMSSWGDLIDYLGDDPHTRSIVIYMESIGDAGRFLSAAREVALNKPIIVIKAGRTAAAAKAAASHTGSLTGSDDVLDAAFRRCGVLRVDTHRRPLLHGRSPRQAAAPAWPAPDHRHQCRRPRRARDRRADQRRRTSWPNSRPKPIERLNAVLPPHWSHSNPIDVIGDAEPERYAQSPRDRRQRSRTPTGCWSS